MKILTIGLGYVGTANAVLLSQQNEVVCYDLNTDRVNQINKKISPIEDVEVSQYLSQKNLNIKGVIELPSENDFDFVIIATPTNYDPDTNYFDTSTVESCIEKLNFQNSKATIIIRSTLPVGFIERIQKKYPSQEIIFVPEFLREGKAVYDSLYPSRIVVGSHSDKAKKFARLMTNYNSKATELGSGFYANPSPGNIKDGLITDAIKSAGAAKKGGTSPIVDVLDYAEQLKIDGLNLLCTPGNDVESTTGLAGSGANIILFTTGLGTPTGNPAVPVLKISTNSELSKKMNDIIDFDTGSIIEGKKSVEECSKELLNFIVSVASGEKEVKARRLGQNDFIPWKRGISL